MTPVFETAAATTSSELRVLDLVNSSRAAGGVGALSLSARLSRMARRHSRRMASERRLFHHSCLSCRFPTGSWRLLGENVGMGPTLRRIHRMMMRSSAHRSIILTGGFEHVGIGVVKKGRYYWVTEIFHG
ncbi:MAG TPA: CAP domain-containing protein [Actinomycetota bacterium]|nr:CAP domain-containing protein [Actinomycetota bacterium]